MEVEPNSEEGRKFLGGSQWSPEDIAAMKKKAGAVIYVGAGGAGAGEEPKSAIGGPGNGPRP